MTNLFHPYYNALNSLYILAACIVIFVTAITVWGYRHYRLYGNPHDELKQIIGGIVWIYIGENQKQLVDFTEEEIDQVTNDSLDLIYDHVMYKHGVDATVTQIRDCTHTILDNRFWQLSHERRV